MTTNAQKRVKEMEELFYENARKLASMIVEQAESSGIDQHMLACACDMISEGVKNLMEKEIKERFGSLEEAEKYAMSMLEEQMEQEEMARDSKGQKIVDIAIARAQGKNIH